MAGMLLIAKPTICQGAHEDDPLFLHKILLDSAQAIHALRLNALVDAVRALIEAQRLSLTALGRQLSNQFHQGSLTLGIRPEQEAQMALTQY